MSEMGYPATIYGDGALFGLEDSAESSSPFVPDQPTATLIHRGFKILRFEGSAYSSPSGTAYDAARWLVTLPDASVLDSGWVRGSLALQQQVSGLTPHDTVSARVQYMDALGLTSALSEAVEGTTLGWSACQQPVLSAWAVDQAPPA